jgi:diketogulonate reductase-like aldo/keto reductase
MNRRPFGPISASIPVIGQGTWNMEGDDRKTAIAALRRGLELGLTHIDTAEMYGRGMVERMVGEAVEGQRSKVFLVSKVLPSNASRRGTIEACEKSLARLGTDYLDCYLLHWPGSHPLEDTIAAFDDLERSGKIRSYGVSNFGKSELEDAIRIAGPGKIACNQVLYHLKERRIEHELVPFCTREGVAVVAYSPFGSGDFPSPKSRGGLELEAVAEKHGASPFQVALTFLSREPHVFAIPKASDVAHIEDNAGALSLSLSAEDMARLDRAFPVGRQRSGVPML